MTRFADFVRTNQVYSNGLSEVILGNAIKKLKLPREEIVVLTKVRCPPRWLARCRANVFSVVRSRRARVWHESSPGWQDTCGRRHYQPERSQSQGPHDFTLLRSHSELTP